MRRLDLIVILLLFTVLSLVGITWGLPRGAVDPYLFGGRPPWPGEKIHRLTGAAEKFSPRRGADVDVDPLARPTGEAVCLTATDEDLARIYLRYRLYTYQPDEMITMMALAGMDPSRLEFDPRLYQYGGLFIYPVGALIGACGAIGLIDVRGDVVYYLDNPDEFGKFYIVARAYAAAWGLLGVVIVFAIGRRLAGARAGVLAALLFTLMPVVVCMAHEGKPHLPGAVLMLLAVLLAMRHLSTRAAGFSPRGASEPPQRAAGFSPRGATDTNEHQTNGDYLRGLTLDASRKGEQPAAQIDSEGKRGTGNWWLMCICCGAALGMVLSSWPIFILIPLVAVREYRGAWESNIGEASPRRLKPAARTGWASGLSVAVKRTVLGVALGFAVYLITNPYIVINAVANREVLRSNFGNSLAMYNIARLGEGFIRVVELTVEGATLPILVFGVAALFIALARKNAVMVPLGVSAIVFFLQFVLIGAGKPAEYGRFGIFTNTALAVGAAALLARRWTQQREVVNWIPGALVAVWVALAATAYLSNFRADATAHGSRAQLAALAGPAIAGESGGGQGLTKLALLGEPAPYCCPPLDFASIDVRLYASPQHFADSGWSNDAVLLYPVDRHPAVARTYSPPAEEGDGRQLVLRYRTQQTNQPETPISWANKPFFIADHTLTVRDAPSPASDWIK